VIDEVALRAHVGPTVDVDREAITDAHERLPDGRDRASVPLDLHLVAHAELALLELGHLSARGVLEHQRLANAERLAVDTERPGAVLLLDPVVVPDREQTLAHLITRADGAFLTMVSQTSHRRSHGWWRALSERLDG
jgi:hypothetical protein